MFRGSWFCGKSACCSLEQDQVIVPVSIAQDFNESSRVNSSIDEYSCSLGFDDEQSPHYEAQSESIVEFKDASTKPVVGDVAGNHVFSSSDANTGVDLGDWLSRPTRISSYTWGPADSAGVLTNFNPWYLFLNSPSIKNKIQNYSWFRGDLRLRFQMTASPFYYGMLKAVYRPLYVLRNYTVNTDPALKFYIQASQLPHVDLLLGEDDSFEMVLPFIYHKNFANLQLASEIHGLGIVDIYNWAALQSANGVSTESVTVRVFAWMENVELSGASAGFALQSDEYGEGCVSKPASWLATASSYFENIPVIGPFATATRIGAGAVSSIARLFGFTNVPVIEDTKPFRSELFPKLASTEIGFPIEKLTLDPKNELSVDPRIVGLPGGTDEMALSSICERESYLTTSFWNVSDSEDTLLFYSRINPNMFDIDTATNPRVFLTPMAQVSRAFVDWRGSVKLRFQVVCSKYHKGKLIISYDPSGNAAQNIGTSTNTSNLVHTAIIDIGETNNFEMTIPYQQATQFLSSRGTYIGNKNWGVNTPVPTYGSFYDPNYDNGVLTVRILNRLTCPVSSGFVAIIVSVSGGSDIEFAQPTNIVDTSGGLSFYAPQSEEFTEQPTPDIIDIAPVQSLPDKQYLVHYGENIRSLRMLLRRYSASQMEPYSLAGLSQFGYVTKTIYRMPVSPGFAALSTINANKIVGAGTFGFNFANMTPLSWFSSSYMAYRGSTNWTFNTDTPSTIGIWQAFRDPYAANVASLTASIAAYTSLKDLTQSYYQFQNGNSAGMALTNTRTQPGLNITNPNYSRYKFAFAQPGNGNLGMVSDASNQSNVKIQIVLPPSNQAVVAGNITNTGILTTYVAAGTDFGLHFFLYVPDVYIYTVPITVA